MTEASFELPRLALGYYFLLAAGVGAGGLCLWWPLRRHAFWGDLFSKVWIYALVYALSSLCVVGNHFPTHNLTADLCAILLLSLPLYSAALTLYEVLRRRSRGGEQL